jgi:hypothetical protein
MFSIARGNDAVMYMECDVLARSNCLIICLTVALLGDIYRLTFTRLEADGKTLDKNFGEGCLA